MENLDPTAQVTSIIVIGVVVCVLILAWFTTFFDRH